MVSCGLILLTIVVLFWRTALLIYWEVPNSRTYFGTDTRIILLYGAILAVILNTRFAGITRDFEHRATIAVSAFVLLLTFLYRDPIFRETFHTPCRELRPPPILRHVIRAKAFAHAHVIGISNDDLDRATKLLTLPLSCSSFVFRRHAFPRFEARNTWLNWSAGQCGSRIRVVLLYRKAFSEDARETPQSVGQELFWPRGLIA